MAIQTDLDPRVHTGGQVLRWLVPLAVLALGAAWLLFTPQPPPPTLNPQGAITVLSPPLALPDFSLQSSEQSTLTRDSLKGRWTLLSLGFTSCPDICPNTLGTLARAVQQTRTAAEDVQVLFVSVDPERDTPADLESYVEHFGPFVVGATGTHERLHELTKPLGLFYQRSAEAADENTYGVEHSTTVLLVGPDAEIVALLRISDLADAELAIALDEFMSRA